MVYEKSIIPVGPILAAIRSLEPFPGDFLYIPKLTRKSRFVVNQRNQSHASIRLLQLAFAHALAGGWSGSPV